MSTTLFTVHLNMLTYMSEVYEVLQHNRVKLQIVRFLMFFFLIEKLLKTTS